MNNNSKLEQAFTIGLLAYDGKFSYAQVFRTFTGISSYQLKRFIDSQWDENQKLEEYIKSVDVDWSTGWLMGDDTIIEKPYAELIECVYWQFSSKNKKSRRQCLRLFYKINYFFWKIIMYSCLKI